jgi:surface protein
MRGMFSDCRSLTSLGGVFNFNTSNVTNMSYMFCYCSSLTTLDVSNFNTSNVTDMRDMFYRCYALTSLNLNNFKVNANTDISGIIAGCTSLTPSTLKMDSFKNIKFKKASSLCEGFKSQEMVDYICSIIDLSENTDFSSMFANIGIKNLVIPKIKIKNGAKINSILGNDNFGSETQKINVDASNVDISDISDVSYIFAWSKRVESLDVSNFNTSKVTNMSNMFLNCESLTTLNISNWDTSNVTNMYCMFDNCTNLTTIVGVIDMKSCTNYNNMFTNCNKLTSVKLKNIPSGFNASRAGLKEGQYTIVS